MLGTSMGRRVGRRPSGDVVMMCGCVFIVIIGGNGVTSRQPQLADRQQQPQGADLAAQRSLLLPDPLHAGTELAELGGGMVGRREQH